MGLSGRVPVGLFRPVYFVFPAVPLLQCRRVLDYCYTLFFSKQVANQVWPFLFISAFVRVVIPYQLFGFWKFPGSLPGSGDDNLPSGAADYPHPHGGPGYRHPVDSGNNAIPVLQPSRFVASQ